MKPKGMFVTALLVVDTFLVSYAVGFNSRHVLVVNPSLPAAAPVSETSIDGQPASPDDKGDKTKAEGKDKKSLAEPESADSKDKGAKTPKSKNKPEGKRSGKKKT
jgi:hypothetical protein